MRRYPKNLSSLSIAFPLLAVLVLSPASVYAGGPRWVAGITYFDPAVTGQPVVWRRGTVNYYTDLGDLSTTVTKARADAMVAAAAALWSGIATAALQINAAGNLAEDVNGTNFLNGSGGLTMPPDVQSSATGTPLGIIYDADGSVLDALLGEGASDPDSCSTNALTTLVDNFATDAKIAHALMIVNGRCTADPAHVALVQYELIRGFGRVLGLDWSQANDAMFPGNTTPDGLLGWPLMHPVEKLCNSNGNPCMTGTIGPRTDDIAALNRLYPITPANVSAFSQKQVTATATISIQGTISFRNGQGMQGVNVVARPLIPGTGQPDMRYPASAVSGNLFRGDAGNVVTGVTDHAGESPDRFGTDTATFEGWYDLSGIPLPPGVTQADYQLTFEPVNPLYTGEESVGPYALGQVAPSGTMPVVILYGLTAGSTVVQNEAISDSAADGNSGKDGDEFEPIPVPVGGEWQERITGRGHVSWFRWHLRGGRQVTVEAQPIDEKGLETEDKARVVIGVWNGDDPLGVAPEVDTPQPFNAIPSGLTTLGFESGNDGDVRVALADQRGDGRPDYEYRGRLLYADAVAPARISVAGGAIVIDGTGFRPGNMVTVNGVAADITSSSPTEIAAIAPASPHGVTGSIDVTVLDPQTGGWTTIEGGSAASLSYDAGGSDELRIVTAPAHAVRIGVPLSFTVRAAGKDGVTPVGGISVTYTVTSGAATLGCGQSSCIATTGGDGLATVAVTARTSAETVVEASLSNGASVITEFVGAVAPQIAAVNDTLYLAAGAVLNWAPQALVLSAGVAFPGQTVTWSAGTGVTVASASTTSGSTGIAWTQVTAGPIKVGANAIVKACVTGGVAGGPGCATFTITGVDSQTAGLIAVSGTDQELRVGDTVAPVVLRVIDAAGDPLAGAVVTLYETLRQWTPACPPQGSCPVGPVMEEQAVEAVSAADGLITFTALSDGVSPTKLDAIAVTGNSATLAISIVRHP